MGFIVGGGVATLVSLRYNRRKAKAEAENEDLQNIGSMVQQITALMAQNRELLQKYLEEQDKNIKLTQENSELAVKIESLEKQIKCLTAKINKLMKNEKEQ
jgi:predicted nuclease with TOPRIM domain